MCLAVLSVAGAHVALGDDKIKELMRSTGHIELKLYGAHVPDLDRLPMQGDSDVFARVFLNDTKEMLCETSVVQDDNSPKVRIAAKFDYARARLTRWTRLERRLADSSSDDDDVRRTTLAPTFARSRFGRRCAQVRAHTHAG